MPVPPATLAALSAMPMELEKLLAAVPARFLRWKPETWDGVPGEMFSSLEHLCHLVDIERDGYQQRFRRTLAETRPSLPSLDGYRMAEERHYRDADPAAALRSFRDARRTTLALLESVADRDLQRDAVFEGHGPVTLRGLVELLCSHDRQHLACLHWLLAKMDLADQRAL